MVGLPPAPHPHNTHTELGIGASHTAEQFTDKRNGMCMCIWVCVCTCVPTPTNTRVKHKAIQLSTWPKGEGSTAEGGKDRWTDGWHGRAGIQMNGSGRNVGSEMCSLGVKGEDG